MLFHPVQGLLAAERRRTLLAEADAYRRAKPAKVPRQRRAPRPKKQPSTVRTPTMLCDGSAVFIRPVQSTDAGRLADGFSRLSDESRRMRFLLPKKRLSTQELRYLTDIDHHDHEALGALDPDDGRGVGITRYVRHRDDPDAAEVAVAVIDEWHRRGLGTLLLGRISERARDEGIRRFTGLVSADNVAMIALLHRFGAAITRINPEAGTYEFELWLVPADQLTPGLSPYVHSYG
jgi:RimJ/RimL family protein N-acetyltransferase